MCTLDMKPARRVNCCSVALLLLLTAPALAQQTEPPPPPADTGQSLESFIPPLPPSVVPPRIAAPHPCSFPHSAMYEHPTRPAVLSFTVTAKGQVTNTTVAQSSGSGRIDEAARSCVSEWVYAPAMRDGAPVDVPWATEISLTITTRSRMAGPPPDAPKGSKLVMMPVQEYRSSVGDCERWHGDAHHGVLLAFDVETDGSVKNAIVAESSGDPAVDKDAVDCISRRAYKPATRDGVPVEIRLTAELFGDQ